MHNKSTLHINKTLHKSKALFNTAYHNQANILFVILLIAVMLKVVASLANRITTIFIIDVSGLYKRSNQSPVL